MLTPPGGFNLVVDASQYGYSNRLAATQPHMQQIRSWPV